MYDTAPNTRELQAETCTCLKLPFAEICRAENEASRHATKHKLNFETDFAMISPPNHQKSLSLGYQRINVLCCQGTTSKQTEDKSIEDDVELTYSICTRSRHVSQHLVPSHETTIDIQFPCSTKAHLSLNRNLTWHAFPSSRHMQGRCDDNPSSKRRHRI